MMDQAILVQSKAIVAPEEIPEAIKKEGTLTAGISNSRVYRHMIPRR
jgi:hypothetical protein